MRKVLRYTTLIGVMLLMLSIADAVVYKAATLAFGAADIVQLWWLGLLLLLLSIGFIAATVLGNYFYNWFTRIFYVVCAGWIGSLVYFFLASCLYGALVGLTHEQHSTAGLVLLGLAALVSIYGLARSQHIRTTRVRVELPHLPADWEGKRMAWISDVHLGQVRGKRYAARIARMINRLHPNIVFIGGDLFDGTSAPNLVEQAEPLGGIVSEHGTFYITGNHEEFGNAAAFIDAVKSVGIRILMDEKIEREGLQIVGVDYLNASDKERFGHILAGLHIDPTKPSILLKHEPNDLKVAHDAGISLQISGHTHLGQQWPFGYLAQRTYKGFAYGLEKLGAMQVYTSSGIGTWGPPLRLGTRSEIVVFTLAGQDA